MDKSQKGILLVGMIIVFLMWIYPPWRYTYEGHASTFTQWAGYYLVFLRPMPYGMRLDLPLLLVQCLAVAIVAIGFVLLLQKLKRT
jgi:hypothetical protein